MESHRRVLLSGTGRLFYFQAVDGRRNDPKSPDVRSGLFAVRLPDEIRPDGLLRFRKRDLAVWIFFSSHAMLSPSVRMVCIPSASCVASPGSRPCTLFQYCDDTTGMLLIVKYLFNLSNVALAPPRRQTATAAAGLKRSNSLPSRRACPESRTGNRSGRRSRSANRRRDRPLRPVFRATYRTIRPERRSGRARRICCRRCSPARLSCRSRRSRS